MLICRLDSLPPEVVQPLLAALDPLPRRLLLQGHAVPMSLGAAVAPEVEQGIWLPGRTLRQVRAEAVKLATAWEGSQAAAVRVLAVARSTLKAYLRLAAEVPPSGPPATTFPAEVCYLAWRGRTLEEVSAEAIEKALQRNRSYRATALELGINRGTLRVFLTQRSAAREAPAGPPSE